MVLYSCYKTIKLPEEYMVVTGCYMVALFVCLGSAVVNMMDSHSCDRGLNPGQGKLHIRYALNNIWIVFEESSAKFVLYV